MRLKIEITTVYGLILLPPLSFTKYSQLENFRFGANVEVDLFYYELLKLSYVKVEKLENYCLGLKGQQ